MEIVLFRHGYSQSSATSISDLERHLLPRGIDEINKSSLNLYNEGFYSKLILSSPLQRAVESATIISEKFNIKEIKKLDFLTPQSDYLKFIEFMSDITENIIVVSHIPLIENIAFALLNKKISFPTGSYLRLKREESNVLFISHYIPLLD